MKVRYAIIDSLVQEKRISFSTEELLYMINSCKKHESMIKEFLEKLLSELDKN